MFLRYRGFRILTGLALCLFLASIAEAGKVRILTRVINPVYHSSGKDGPPVRLIQNKKPYAPSPSQPNHSTNSNPNPNAQPKPHQHREPYPFAFDSFDRYPGGYYTNRYPFGYYLGGYRYPFSYPYYDATPRLYGPAPLPYEALNDGGMFPWYGYGFGFGGGYGGFGNWGFGGYGLGGFGGYGLGGYGLGGYGFGGYGFGGYGLGNGIYYGGPYGYQFGPTYPVAMTAYTPNMVYGAYAPGWVGNPYFGATQWPGYIPQFQPVAPLVP